MAQGLGDQPRPERASCRPSFKRLPRGRKVGRENRQLEIQISGPGHDDLAPVVDDEALSQASDIANPLHSCGHRKNNWPPEQAEAWLPGRRPRIDRDPTGTPATGVWCGVCAKTRIEGHGLPHLETESCPSPYPLNEKAKRYYDHQPNRSCFQVLGQGI